MLEPARSQGSDLFQSYCLEMRLTPVDSPDSETRESVLANVVRPNILGLNDIGVDDVIPIVQIANNGRVDVFGVNFTLGHRSLLPVIFHPKSHRPDREFNFNPKGFGLELTNQPGISYETLQSSSVLIVEREAGFVSSPTVMIGPEGFDELIGHFYGLEFPTKPYVVGNGSLILNILCKEAENSLPDEGFISEIKDVRVEPKNEHHLDMEVFYKIGLIDDSRPILTVNPASGRQEVSLLHDNLGFIKVAAGRLEIN